MFYRKSLGLLICVISISLINISAIANSSITQDDDEQGITPIMRAVRDGEHKELKELLRRRPDLSAKDPYEWTALTYALNREDTEVLKLLIKNGADVNERDSKGYTLLMNAATQGQPNVVKLLLENGADVNALNANGYSALGLIQNNGRKNIISMLEEAGAIAITPDAKQLKLVTKLGLNQPPVTRAVDQRPVAISSPRPMYTEEARRNKISGSVRMLLLVGDDGRVKRTRIISGLPDGLSREARRAAYEITFNPAIRDGLPVEFWMPIDISFNIK